MPQNLGPIDESLSVPTKQYVDDTAQVYSGPTAPTNPNVLIWIDTGA